MDKAMIQMFHWKEWKLSQMPDGRFCEIEHRTKDLKFKLDDLVLNPAWGENYKWPKSIQRFELYDHPHEGVFLRAKLISHIDIHFNSYERIDDLIKVPLLREV